MYLIKFDEVSNAADWTDVWQVLGEDGVPSDIYADGWTVTVKVARLPAFARSWSEYSGALNTSTVLTASTADGTVTVNGDDALVWTFTAAQMANLAPGPYAAGGLATKDGQTVQLFLGTLPVIQGL
jgi:hypothetical protein